MMQVSGDGCKDSRKMEGRAKRPGFQYTSLLVCIFCFVYAEHPLFVRVKQWFHTKCVRGLKKYGCCSTKSNQCVF